MKNPRRVQFTNGNVTEYLYFAEDEKLSTDKVLFNGRFCSFTDSNQPVSHYFTQDHLGNNRAVVDEDGTLEQVTHYYPFGGVYDDVGFNASAQPYKYNGKELDNMHGLNTYDYGARQYNPVTARWDKMDPNKNKYPSYLATPNGSLQKYDPKTGKTVVINNNMPSDFKDPTRKNNVSSRETEQYNFKDEIEWLRRIDQEAANERIINIR